MAAIMHFLFAAAGVFCVVAQAAFGADAAMGKELFRGCAGCHSYDSDVRKAGPPLRTLFGKVTLRNGERATEDNVRELILEGFNRMPSYRYQFQAEEFDDLIAFLKTLNARPGLFQREKLASGKPVNDQNVMALMENGHADMKGTKNWLDAGAEKALLLYMKSLL